MKQIKISVPNFIFNLYPTTPTFKNAPHLALINHPTTHLIHV